MLKRREPELEPSVSSFSPDFERWGEEEMIGGWWLAGGV